MACPVLDTGGLIERDRLLQHNLFDSYASSAAKPPSATCGDAEKRARTLDGSCNNLEEPSMGMVGYRFGRNIAPEWVEDGSRLLEPNPREVANELLLRDEFKPAETINMMAAAWVQFQVHDWMNHGRNVAQKDYIRVPLPENDRWRPEAEELLIPRTTNDSQAGDNRKGHVSYANQESHWWDMSQVYGTTQDTNSKIRSFVDGKLKLDEAGLLPTDTDGMEVTGMKKNWWIGLAILHNLFTKEHNSICDYLKEHHPNMDDQELYDKARLINTAVNAKIHTVEWTPALLADEIGYIALNSNWYGLKKVFPDEKLMSGLLQKLGILSSDSSDGIVGHPAQFNGVPFSLTEEFTAVYRFHALLPENITVVDSETGESLDNGLSIMNCTFKKATQMMHEYQFKDLLATFGSKSPGSLTLNNYPKAMTDFTVPYDHPQVRIDIATIDVIRDRERGVPRFNNLRRGLNLRPVKTFEELTTDKEVLSKLKKIYKSVEDIDCMIGLLAEEPRPLGWAFGDTTFTVFVAMASRRLLTDRFLTNDFTPDYYTQEGIDWVSKTGFKDVLLRHEPSLSKLLSTVSNPFAPWTFKS
ncbi:hypothetical protein NQZ79_g3838 [Umbelopsis isabellina]|nr:hypothetical protein NQZ79_g3838 [Umbelopsis isabellina]